MQFTMTSGKHFGVDQEVFEIMEINELPTHRNFDRWFWDSLMPFEYGDVWFEAWDRGEDEPEGDKRFTEVWKDHEEFQKRQEERTRQSAAESLDPER